MPQLEMGTQPTAYSPNVLDDLSQGIARTTAFVKQGQVPVSSGLPAFTSVTNPTTITITLPAANVTFADGSVILFNGGTLNFVGLTASTQYYCDLAYNLSTGVWTGALYLAPPAQIQILQDTSQDGYVPYLTGYSDATNFKTTAAGSGGGSGGGGGTGSGCPAAHQPIETKEHGFIRADELRVGMHLRAPNGGWHRINALNAPKPCIVWRISAQRSDGFIEKFDVNDGHLIRDIEGHWQCVMFVDLHTYVEAPHGRPPSLIVGVDRIGSGFYVPIDCENHDYALGSTVGHNNTIQCPAVFQEIERIAGRGRADTPRASEFVPAGKLEVGDYLRSPLWGWNRINKLERRIDRLWCIQTDIERVYVNAGHCVQLTNKNWVCVTDLRPGDEIRPPIGQPNSRVVEAYDIGPGVFVAIDCDNHEYVLGKQIGHNITL
jgi:hypothetical protein